MKISSLVLVVTCCWGFISLSHADNPPWPPAGGVPLTQWGKQVVDATTALPAYPRPQLVRQDWQNLNGLWDYAITAKDAQKPTAYDGKILVPFPVESILSKVNKRVDEKSRLWYHCTFQIPASWKNQRVLLHCGAVDWETSIIVNGSTQGMHRGGYDAITQDITDQLKKTGPQELVISVWDPTDAGQPNGKQSRHPEGIFYTPTTGIWQTVWLEPVSETHLDDLKLVPDVDKSQLHLSALVDHAIPPLTHEIRMTAQVLDRGKVVAQAEGWPHQTLNLAIPQPKLWWPDAPFLYDLRVILKRDNQVVDSVTSYFGMRKISIGSDAKGVTRILLNNQFVLQNGLLDQGFWPDGLYTAPTDEALRYDIEMTRKLGFNMARKHIKVEPDRWYYWADKLGLLVWQDMPAATSLMNKQSGASISDPVGEYETELRRMVEGRFNHPCIVLWVLFNEGMGLDMGLNETPTDNTKAILKRMVDVTRQADATRLINAESGAGGGGWQGRNVWDTGLGDIVDFHDYGKSNAPIPEKHRASVIGEYGFAVAPVYSVSLMLPQVPAPGASGLLLTQLTDVENEHNGALNYDRTLKGNETAEQIGAAMRKQTEQWLGPH